MRAAPAASQAEGWDQSLGDSTMVVRTTHAIAAGATASGSYLLTRSASALTAGTCKANCFIDGREIDT